MRYEFRPLTHWPDPVTDDRRRSPFSAPWTKTLALLGRETEYLGADLVVLQVDAPVHKHPTVPAAVEVLPKVKEQQR